MLLDLANCLAPILESGATALAPLGSMARLSSLSLLHREPKINEGSDQLVLPTLGSQEGAFVNVKMNFSGEQGQTIRQLLTAHMVRRGIMCQVPATKILTLVSTLSTWRLTQCVSWAPWTPPPPLPGSARACGDQHSPASLNTFIRQMEQRETSPESQDGCFELLPREMIIKI